MEIYEYDDTSIRNGNDNHLSEAKMGKQCHPFLLLIDQSLFVLYTESVIDLLADLGT